MAEKLYRSTPRGREEIPEDEANEIRAMRAKSDIDREARRHLISREMSYPSFADQFDQIFHEGIDKWKETIQAVKDAHPKL